MLLKSWTIAAGEPPDDLHSLGQSGPALVQFSSAGRDF